MDSSTAGSIHPVRHTLTRAVSMRQALILVTRLALLMLFTGSVSAASFTLQNNRWEQLVLPSAPADSSISGLFGDDLLASGFGSSWTVFTFNPGTQRYNDPAITDTLDQGEAFWIIQRTGNPVVIDVPDVPEATAAQSAACPSTGGCAELALPVSTSATSWTLIGAPFAQSTNIGNARIVSGGAGSSCTSGCNLNDAATAQYTSSQVWSYDSSINGYRELNSANSLNAWQGFWFPTLAQPASNSLTLLMPKAPNSSVDIELRNLALGRGINFGNALEAPSEGEWGITLQANYFDIIADAGFDSVRVPIRWSAHAANASPYTIDQAFFERIDWVLEQSARTGLTTIINMHHYDELMADPAGHRARFLGLWRQIATRYANQPQSIYFEVLNEPHNAFSTNPSVWNSLFADALNIIRETNPTRAVVVGPVGYNAINDLDQLTLPADPNLIVTVHFYSPFEFTHQGATWVSPVPPLGASWNGSTTQLGSAFQNWSWQTTLTPQPGSMQVAYDAQYAGFNLRSINPIRPQSLTIDIRGNANLDVTCRADADGDFTRVDNITNSGTSWRTVTVNLSACSAATDNVVLQNIAPGAQTMELRGGELCSSSGCKAIVSTAGAAVSESLTTARDWGTANNRPIYVGEFGAYEPGDMASRARWTTQVQSTVQSLGMSSAYWEFGAGFGAYDLANGQWRAPLFDALMSSQ